MVCLERLRKTMKTGSLEYEAGVVTTTPQFSVRVDVEHYDQAHRLL